MTRSRIVFLLIGVAACPAASSPAMFCASRASESRFARRRGPVARPESSNATAGRSRPGVTDPVNDPAAAANVEVEPDPAPPPIFDGNSSSAAEAWRRTYRCPPQATGIGAGGDCGGASRHRPLSRPGRTRPVANQPAPPVDGPACVWCWAMRSRSRSPRFFTPAAPPCGLREGELSMKPYVLVFLPAFIAGCSCDDHPSVSAPTGPQGGVSLTSGKSPTRIRRPRSGSPGQANLHGDVGAAQVRGPDLVCRASIRSADAATRS